MELEFNRGGNFLLKIDSGDLSKGLRPSRRAPRNSGYLTQCDGAVGRDGVLQVLDQLTKMDVTSSEVTGTDAKIYTCKLNHTSAADNRPITGANYATYWELKGSTGGVWVIDTTYKALIADGFPYPQIFVFTNMIIVCSATKIYEWVAGALVLKLTVTTGDTWSCVDFHDYIYMSNGVVAVIRDAMDKTYKVVTDLPVAKAICNFNGQVVVGGLV